jgi:hypothetical protein
MESGELFPTVLESASRQGIFESVMRWNYMIPTFNVPGDRASLFYNNVVRTPTDKGSDITLLYARMSFIFLWFRPLHLDLADFRLCDEEGMDNYLAEDASLRGQGETTDVQMTDREETTNREETTDRRQTTARRETASREEATSREETTRVKLAVKQRGLKRPPAEAARMPGYVTFYKRGVPLQVAEDEVTNTAQ